MQTTKNNSSTASKKRATIRDVAARAGVSKSLVSLVYSTPDGVSEGRRKRVLQAAEELGFTPNFLARSLAADTGTFVGILVADLHNPLFAEIVDRVRFELEERGQYGFMTSAMLMSNDGRQIVDRRTVRALIDLRPKSVLVVGTIPKVNGLAVLPENIQIVIAAATSENLPRALSIRTDDQIGINSAVAHLVDKGHLRISYIGLIQGVIAKNRREAYLCAMQSCNLSDYVQIESQTSDIEFEGYLSAKRLLDSQNPPTAIICYNDIIAIGAQQAIDDYIRQGGQSIALVGYDNTYLSALRQISLTSIDHDTSAIAKQCAERLIESSRSQSTSRGEFLLKPKLIERESSNFHITPENGQY